MWSNKEKKQVIQFSLSCRGGWHSNTAFPDMTLPDWWTHGVIGETHTHGEGRERGERKWCISFGMMNTVNREKRRLKNRLWGEPIKGCAQMVNTLWCKAELIKVRGSGSLHFFFHLVGTISFFIWQLLIRFGSIGPGNGANPSSPYRLLSAGRDREEAKPARNEHQRRHRLWHKKGKRERVP